MSSFAERTERGGKRKEELPGQQRDLNLACLLACLLALGAPGRARVICVDLGLDAALISAALDAEVTLLAPGTQEGYRVVQGGGVCVVLVLCLYIYKVPVVVRNSGNLHEL